MGECWTLESHLRTVEATLEAQCVGKQAVNEKVYDSIRHIEACGVSLPKSISNIHVPWYAWILPVVLRLSKPNLIQFCVLLEIGKYAGLL